jgi:hypothetical protein
MDLILMNTRNKHAIGTVQRGACWSGRGTREEEKVDYKPMMQRPALVPPKRAGRTSQPGDFTSLHWEVYNKAAYQHPVQ